jgi:hypothetical protein
MALTAVGRIVPPCRAQVWAALKLTKDLAMVVRHARGYSPDVDGAQGEGMVRQSSIRSRCADQGVALRHGASIKTGARLDVTWGI